MKGTITELVRGQRPGGAGASLVAGAAILAALAVGCGGDTTTSPAADVAGGEDGGAADAGIDGAPSEAGDAGDAGDGADQGPVGPPGLAGRGFVPERVIIHLHSAYSHDACDDEGLDEAGNPNQACVDRMRAAVCKEHIAVAFMTDHPSYMKDTSFEDLVYANEAWGDVILRDADGKPWAAGYHCPEGEGGADGRTWLLVGFEGNHTMPIGLRHHLDDPSLYGVGFETAADPARLDELVAGVEAAGGMLAIAHSEREDVDGATIAAHGAKLSEVYNFHANFNTLMDGDLLGALYGLDAFLDTSPGAPPADLSGMLLLQEYPEEQIHRWRVASAVRPITGFAAADAHENVVIPAICGGGLDCSDIAAEHPHLAAFLEVGGNMILNDGERVDAYGRVFRWASNRVWIDPDAVETDPIAATEAALRAGHLEVVFEIFGEPHGEVFVAKTEAGEVVNMGGSVAAVGATLWARSPNLPVPNRTATWTDASAAQLESTLFRVTADGTEALMTWSGSAAWVELPAPTPGVYYVETRVTPLHLKPLLGGQAALADVSYRWVISNAIRVE